MALTSVTMLDCTSLACIELVTSELESSKNQEKTFTSVNEINSQFNKAATNNHLAAAHTNIFPSLKKCLGLCIRQINIAFFFKGSFYSTVKFTPTSTTGAQNIIMSKDLKLIALVCEHSRSLKRIRKNVKLFTVLFFFLIQSSGMLEPDVH